MKVLLVTPEGEFDYEKDSAVYIEQIKKWGGELSFRDSGEVETSDGSTADYYELPPDATQLQDLISARDMNAQIGEIFRACYRYGLASHSDKLRDAKKILFYAQAEVDRLTLGVSKP